MGFKRIVACVDLSHDITNRVLTVSGELAQLMKAKILLTYVVEREVPLLISEGIVLPKVELEKFEGMYRLLEDKSREKMEGLARELAEEWQVEVEPVVLVGEPFDMILEKAEEEGADLIVVGSHGKKGIERLLLGSVSEKVARKAKCSVLVVR